MSLAREQHVVCDPKALQVSCSLRVNYDEISKLINLVELEIYLTEKDILEDEEIDYVINELDQERAFEYVLRRVKERGNDGYKDFLWCLEQTSERNIGHGYLSALLRGDEFTDETQKKIKESLKLQERYRRELDIMQMMKDSININDLIAELRSDTILTDDEMDELQLPDSRQNKVMKLLHILSTKGPLVDLIFMDVLERTILENPAHSDILERVYGKPCKPTMKQNHEDETERDGTLSNKSVHKQLRKRKRDHLDEYYATKVSVSTPMQVRAHGIIMSDKYFDKINEIRRLHYLGDWDGAEKVVEECMSMKLTEETKCLRWPADELSPTIREELYVAVALRNCSGYVTRKMRDKIFSVISEAKKLCRGIDNDNGRVLESKCEWMLAKMYRYSKDFDKAMEHIENAQLIHLRFNIAPGEDTTLSNYCKGCILASQLAQTNDWSSFANSRKLEEAKLCFRKATEHAVIRDFAIYPSHHMIRLAQLCLHSSQFVAGDCNDEEQIKEAESALNSEYIDEKILAPRTKCLFYVTRSDLYRNKQMLELAKREAKRALDIANKNNFATEIKSAMGRLDKIRDLALRRELNIEFYSH